MKVLSKLCFSVFVVLVLFGCQSNLATIQVDKHYEWQYQLPEQDYVVSAIGYAPIESQMGADKTTKMVKAIKASKLDAYRDLTEKVHGYKLDGDVKVSDLVLGNERVRASVQGVIKGARLVKSYHLDGVYITELELNLRDLYRVRAFTNGQTRIINAQYH
ncbi:LPP20 family lipoprotein [Catenovulum sediminis]|uniref:LPP20 family lipoprotein n=1 Tax=Catenovulum sediminis TaxID=1740262 RepID=A0ABV1RHB7_9ALTE|nr:LPP20 family lipoprotein [Catenovulum sediminis]